MITDQTYQQEEAKVKKLFAEAGWYEKPLPNEERIDRIEERALHERITKESADFIFTSFGAVLSNFTNVFLGSVEHETQDYKV